MRIISVRYIGEKIIPANCYRSLDYVTTILIKFYCSDNESQRGIVVRTRCNKYTLKSMEVEFFLFPLKIHAIHPILVDIYYN